MSMPHKNQDRISFASIKNQLEYPDFLEVQLKSFQDFFQLETTPENRKAEGLYQVFHENFPITEVLSSVLRGSGSCAEVKWLFLSMSMPMWTLIWYIGLGLMTLWLGYRAVNK